MENNHHEIQSVYLYPQENHTYGAIVSAGFPSTEGAVKLTDIKAYPVDMYYSRTDLNGSLCYEMDHCTDQNELLSSLDWCGRCRYMIHQIWDFDLRETKNEALLDLLSDANRYRHTLIAQEAEKFAEALREDTDVPLSVKIQDAQQCASSSGTHNPQIVQERSH